MTPVPRLLLLACAYGLAVASVYATRVLRSWTLAEALAVGAFVCGSALWLWYRRDGDRLLWTGAALGLVGLPLKGLFVLLGVGEGGHDPVTHAVTPGSPLLVHIHHLSFNLGFLCYLLSALAAGWRAFRAP